MALWIFWGSLAGAGWGDSVAAGGRGACFSPAEETAPWFFWGSLAGAGWGEVLLEHPASAGKLETRQARRKRIARFRGIAWNRLTLVMIPADLDPPVPIIQAL